jgi:hypothetical protein
MGCRWLTAGAMTWSWPTVRVIKNSELKTCKRTDVEFHIFLHSARNRCMYLSHATAALPRGNSLRQSFSSDGTRPIMGIGRLGRMSGLQSRNFNYLLIYKGACNFKKQFLSHCTTGWVQYIDITSNRLLDSFISQEYIFSQLHKLRLTELRFVYELRLQYYSIIGALSSVFCVSLYLFNSSRQQSRGYPLQCNGMSFIKNNRCSN